MEKLERYRIITKGKQLEEDRYYRNLGMKEREKFRLQRIQEQKQAQAKPMQFGNPNEIIVIEAQRTGELLNCWKGLDRIHSKVLP